MNEQRLMDPVRAEIEELAEVILFQSVPFGDGTITPGLCGGIPCAEFETPIAKGGQTKDGGGSDNQFDDNFENDGK